MERFYFFVNDMEMKEQHTTAKKLGENRMDLSSYIEYQTQYKVVTKFHKRTLQYMRKFWRLVGRTVEYPIDNFVDCIKKIDTLQEITNNMYRALLVKYPTAVQVIRSYAQFMLFVKNNDKRAKKFFQEAVRIEEEPTGDKNGVDANAAYIGDAVVVDDKVDSIIMISEQGIILTVNKNCKEMFGYSENEMMGRNVSMLVRSLFMYT